MSVLVGEELAVSPEVDQIIVEPEEIVSAALQEHIGPDVRLRNYQVWLRKDFTGPPSHKVKCGEAVLVECHTFTDDGFQKETLVDPALPEAAFSLLKAMARRESAKPNGRRTYRDYPSQA